jgi:hypothetical protein
MARSALSGPLSDDPIPTEPRAGGTFPSAFWNDLKTVHDAEIEKDADEWVTPLAELFEKRRTTIRKRRFSFLADLKLVYHFEGGREPEQHLSLLASRLDQWRSETILQLEKYVSVLPVDDPLRCPISLFGTLGLGRVETAHTSALAWLLHPAQSHGLGACLVDALMTHLAKDENPSQLSVHEMLTEYRVVFGGEYLGRIDVFGTGTWTTSRGTPQKWLLAIEAKIDAAEGDQQLEKYDEWIDAHRGDRAAYRVFLTPEGRRPEAADWIPMSFLDLVRVFRKPYLQLRERPGFHFLRFYLTSVLKDICRWKIPLGDTEACEDPYGVVDYLKTAQSSSQGA